MRKVATPFTVEVLPAPTCATACSVRLKSSSTIPVGDTIRLWVQARDRFRNTRSAGGDRFALSIRRSDVTAAVGEQRRPIKGEVEDNDDATYSATVQVTISGKHSMMYSSSH